MTTAITSFPTALTDDASFRAWGSSISAQLAAVGLVRTSDTGQINWATATWPAVGGAIAGYEMYRFSDSLQDTKPIFIKLEYSAYSASRNLPGIRVTIGTSTNGAGGISGIGSVNPMNTGGSAISSPAGCYCCASPSSLYLVFGQLTSVAAHLFIERSKDASGQYTGDGWFQLHSDQNTSAFSCRTVPYLGPEPSYATNGVAAVPPTTGVSSLSNKVVLSPVLVPILAKPRFASICVVKNGDIGTLAPFIMNHLGAIHTFLALPMSSSIPIAPGTNGNFCSWAIPWE